MRGLCIQDIKSMRSASKQWTDVGAARLFKCFTFRRDKDSYAIFDRISDTAIIASTTALKLELRAMPIMHAVKEMNLAYVRQREVCPTQLALNFLDDEKEYAMDEYSKWNHIWHENNQLYDGSSRLREVFAKVKGLKSIEFAYKSCPFKTDLAMQAWGVNWFKSMQAHRELLYVLTLLAGTTKIKNFRHDRLPIIFFIDFRPDLLQPSRCLEQVHLCFSAHITPSDEFWVNLGAFLKTLPVLRELQLEFRQLPSKYGRESCWADSRGRTDMWFIALRVLLGGHTWTRLKSVYLGDLLLCEEDMVDFFDRHAATLESVTLSRIGLLQGSLKNVLTHLAHLLCLKDFNIGGFCRAFHYPDEMSNFGPCVTSIDDRWSDTFQEFVRIHEAKPSLIFDDVRIPRRTPVSTQREIEVFVLRTVDAQSGLLISDKWPITAVDCLAMCYSFSHHGGCGGCLAQCFDIVKEAKLSWESRPQSGPGNGSNTGGNISGPILDIGEAPIVDFYDAEGYNTFTRLDNRDRPRPDEVGRYVAHSTNRSHREFHEGIRSRIPRYAGTLGNISKEPPAESPRLIEL